MRLRYDDIDGAIKSVVKSLGITTKLHSLNSPLLIPCLLILTKIYFIKKDMLKAKAFLETAAGLYRQNNKILKGINLGKILLLSLRFTEEEREIAQYLKEIDECLIIEV